MALTIATRPRSRLRSPWRALVTAGVLVAGCSGARVDVVDLAPGSLGLGLLAHWSCDEGGEGPLLDRSGNRYDGIVRGPARIAGRFGGALQFEPGNWVNVPSFPQAARSWSVALWYRAPRGAFGDGDLPLVGNQQPLGGGWELSVRLTDGPGRYRFGFPLEADGGRVRVSVEAQLGERDRWVHLAAVLDGPAGRLTFFEDGQQVDETAAEAPIKRGGDNLAIGRSVDAQRLLVGDLDDIAIFSRALVPAEVRVLAAGPVPVLR